MKKNYLILLFLMVGIFAKAQQIPNGNFEQWMYDSTSMSNIPLGWNSSNLGQVGDTGVYRVSPGYNGNFACGLKTSFVLGTYTTSAFLSTTFPIVAKPVAMEIYIKGNIALNDTTIIFVEFGQDTNIIADGSLFLTQSLNSFTKFTIPIDFFGLGNPDSCTITVLSGGFEIDDTLTNIIIDGISFTYPVNIESLYFGAKGNINLYPNPASEILNIQCSLPYQSAYIFNSIGQLVAALNNETSLSVATFEKGIYYLQLLDNKQQIIAKQSFIKN